MTVPRTTPPAAPATEAAAGRTVNVNLQASEDIDGLRQLVRVFDANSPSDDNAEARVTAGFARGLLAAFDALVSLVAATEQQRSEARRDADSVSYSGLVTRTLQRAETAERRAAETEAALQACVDYIDDSFVFWPHGKGNARRDAIALARAALSVGGPERTTT